MESLPGDDIPSKKPAFPQHFAVWIQVSWGFSQQTYAKTKDKEARYNGATALYVASLKGYVPWYPWLVPEILSRSNGQVAQVGKTH